MSRSEDGDRRISAWWDEVLAGDSGEPHPQFGDDVHIAVRDDTAILSGDLRRREDRDELIRQAEARLGRGFHDVDTTRLRLADNAAERGVLEQTLIAAYPDTTTARLAGRFVVKHGRVKPKEEVVIEPGANNLRPFVPAGYVEDAKKRLARGEALLVMRVDETDAFRARELMEEDTRSIWTIASPPRPS